MKRINDFLIPAELQYLFQYLLLVLECDTPILESVFLTFPLLLTVGQTRPQVFFIILFTNFVHILGSMGCVGGTRDRETLDDEDKRSFCIWETGTGPLHQPIPKLRVICHDDSVMCVLTNPTDLHKHLASFQIYREFDRWKLTGIVRNETQGMSRGLILEIEELRLLPYRYQLRRLFEEFMRVRPTYWQSYKPLPPLLAF
jgi:hypothetical protein